MGSSSRPGESSEVAVDLAAELGEAGERALARALTTWEELRDPQVRPLPGGLIHRSFAVRDGDVEYILQRVSPIFELGIQDNIRAVTTHLEARGVPTFRLLPNREGSLFTDLGEGGVWRLETRLPGVGFDVCGEVEQARSASALVARFHSALADLHFDFRPLGIPLHDTEQQLRGLEELLTTHRGHRLYEPVSVLARRILEIAAGWEPMPGLPSRIVHGDLKFNNVLFAGEGEGDRCRAVGLIDLDTVSPQPLFAELGDAWRSWCNRNGEDREEAALDDGLFEAAVTGYLEALEIPLSASERRSLALGVERISLELAARFAADALRESYFGWDATRFASAGEHNLLRARGQFSLHRQARERREAWLALLG